MDNGERKKKIKKERKGEKIKERKRRERKEKIERKEHEGRKGSHAGLPFSKKKWGSWSALQQVGVFSYHGLSLFESHSMAMICSHIRRLVQKQF